MSPSKVTSSEDKTVTASLKKLGVSKDQLLSTEERCYKFMVKYCRETGELPRPNQISDGAGMSGGSITRVMDRLIEEGKVAKIGLGVYVPIVED